MTMKFCSNCGSPVGYHIPDGDDRPRYVCDACKTIHYENPKMVVGCIAEWEDKILLCRRAIEPGMGKWTIPAGYLENAETVSDGAMRETLEEANARVEIISPYTLYNLTFISQIYFIFRARLMDIDFGPTEESSEVKLLAEKDIPWDQIAFDVIRQTLVSYFKDRPGCVFGFRIVDITQR